MPGPVDASMDASKIASASASKKQDHREAGRRKLEEYRNRKAKDKKTGGKGRTDGRSLSNELPEEASLAEPRHNLVAVQGLQQENFSSADMLNHAVNGLVVEGTKKPDNEHSVNEETQGFVRSSNESANSASREKSSEIVWKVRNSSGAASDQRFYSLADSMNGTDSKLMVGSYMNSVQGGTNESASDTFLQDGYFQNNSELASKVFTDGNNNLDEALQLQNGPLSSLGKKNYDSWHVSGSNLDSIHGTDLSYKEESIKRQGSSEARPDDAFHSGHDNVRPVGSLFGSNSISALYPTEQQDGAASSSNILGSSSIMLQNNEAAPWEKIKREQPNLSTDSNAMNLGMSTEPSFSNMISKHNLRRTEPSFLSRTTDRLTFTPSTLSVFPTPKHQSLATDLPPATFKPELGKPTQQNNLPVPSADAIPRRLDVGPQNLFDEAQRKMERNDFASLEQLIDDLTQEKFSLQRALDAARSLAESLAQENSALTESFNSQGAVISQLQADIERQKGEIKAQSLVVSSFMVERERAQQESNSALERSHILAGEVIGLEEKVLKLRSSELKLQRDLETIMSENESYRGRVAMLEKDRQNLKSMLDALQEEKKLLLTQLQKNLHPTPTLVSSPPKESRDACTSTEDLDLQATPLPGVQGRIHPAQELTVTNNSSESSSIPWLHGQENLIVPSAVATLPVDHFRAINNIDSLITELAIEKDTMLKALKKESSRASELELLNAELSKKLELQTQRLELVIAQNMVHSGSTTVTSAPEEQQESEFVDEGDEVVERVLGWIMRLFPSGSSKRRTSKLL